MPLFFRVARPVPGERFPVGPFQAVSKGGDYAEAAYRNLSRGLDPRPRPVTGAVLIPLSWSERLFVQDMYEHNPNGTPQKATPYAEWSPLSYWPGHGVGRKLVPRHGDEWKYGFPDKDLLDLYFGDYLDDLGDRFGYSVWTYEIPSDDFYHAEGTKYCIAKLDNARLLRAMNCADYVLSRVLSFAARVGVSPTAPELDAVA